MHVLACVFSSWRVFRCWLLVCDLEFWRQDGKQIFSTMDKLKGGSDARTHQTIERKASMRLVSRDEVELKKMNKHDACFDLEIDCNVEGDIRVVLYDHDTMPPRDEVACFLWFHTGFVAQSTMVFEKHEIDMAWSDKKCKVFDTGFKMEFYFEHVPTEQETFEQKASSALSQMRRQHSVAGNSSEQLLGSWHAMPTPNPRTLERAAKYRGGGNNTSMRQTFSIVIDEDLTDCNALE